jgi:hypothetical protein
MPRLPMGLHLPEFEIDLDMLRSGRNADLTEGQVDAR